MLAALSVIRPMVGLRFEAASRISLAVLDTWVRTGTVLSLLLIGVNALLITPTRLSIRLAAARMPVRKITAVSAQRTTMTSMIPGRAVDVKRRINYLLRVALERRQHGQQRRGADVGQVTVDLLELKVDVEQILLSADEGVVDVIDLRGDQSGASAVRVLDRLQGAIDGLNDTQHVEQHVGRVDQRVGDRLTGLVNANQHARGVDQRAGRVDQRRGRVLQG